MTEPAANRRWIVYCGTLLDTTKGGGIEFFGVFTHSEAISVRQALVGQMLANGHCAGTFLCEAVETLQYHRVEKP